MRSGKLGAAPGGAGECRGFAHVGAGTKLQLQAGGQEQAGALSPTCGPSHGVAALEEGCKPLCTTVTPLGTGIPNKRQRQGVVLLLLVFKHPDGWFAIPSRGEQGVGVRVLHMRHKARGEDGELSNVQEWTEHVLRKGLPTGDGHNKVRFHDPT